MYKRQIIYEASKLFTEDIKEVEEIRGSLLRREKINTTYIKDLEILLLHCKCKCLSNGRFGYLRIMNKFSSERGLVKGALVSIIPENPKEITSELISKINGAIIEDEDFFRVLNEEENEGVSKEVERILKEIYIRKVQLCLEG